MNYGEELAYWYLRLNGFFPIKNFVIHKSEEVIHRSDIDVLAIRAPHVFEPIGGNNHDWDPYLLKNIKFGNFTAVICEVKTGRFDETNIFREEQLRFAISRTGLLHQSKVDATLQTLTSNAVATDDSGIQIAKLLVSQEKYPGNFLNVTPKTIRNFLKIRIKKYNHEKFPSRMFFPSEILQNLIDQYK